jgi:hypothetical protein
MRRCEDEKMRGRPPLLEEPCAQTLSGIEKKERARGQESKRTREQEDKRARGQERIGRCED